jgi:hypothetical protein
MVAARLRLILPVFVLIAVTLFLLNKNFRVQPDHRNTAHIFMLTTLNVWDSENMATYHFAPVQTWPQAKKFNHYYKRLEDKIGNNYYVSHPPLAFIANYFIIKTLGLPINQRSLQMIIAFLLIAGALILAWIAGQLSAESNLRFKNHIMLAAMVMYLLNPVNLFAHSYHNFSEIWGQFFLILSLAAWLLYLKSDRVIASRIFLFIATALLASTDWMGITFLAAIVLIYWKRLKIPHIRRGILVAASAIVGTNALVVVQYVSIAGFDAFVRAIGIRFLERSGYFGNQYTDMGYHILNPDTWLLLLQQIHNLLVGPGYLVLTMFAVAIFFIHKTKLPNESKVLVLAFFTAFLFFFAVFSAGSTHYIYTARFTPFLALAIAHLYEKIAHSCKRKAWFIAVFIATMHLLGFWALKEFKNKSFQQENKQIQLDIASKVISEQKRDSISLNSNWEERDIIYLSWQSKRNLVWIKD